MDFNPRTPCGVRHYFTRFRHRIVLISIHAPHAGCDDSPSASASVPVAFQSTHPMRGATALFIGVDIRHLISIHAPHAGCDRGRPRTLPVFGHFNPRTPCGVRLRSDRSCQCFTSISIHAPHAGCDMQSSGLSYSSRKFQSTHPMRGATRPFRPYPMRRRYFNPRTPCGVRPSAADSFSACAANFNPRTPCGVRLEQVINKLDAKIISIHAPHAGCDVNISLRREGGREFQSTHPMRGATRRRCHFLDDVGRFQSTHPMRGATVW